MNKPIPQWRQGDVLVEAIPSLPKEASRRPHAVLAEGQITGHSHRMENETDAWVFEAEGKLYLQVVAEHALLVHDEHKPIPLPRGYYRVWKQREFDPETEENARDVLD